MSKSARPAIRLRGVRHNNLKNFDLDLPLHQLIVITGLSGSGKSSLAFDTLFAEGQRRYIETFSPYARQFFDRMDKPQVDSIEGIPPAIAIEQRNAVRTTRSTVGTMTEICDYMKLLWPHIAQLHCRKCGKLVQKDSPQSVWKSVASSQPSATFANSKKGESEGQKRAKADEVLITFNVPLSEKLPLEESLALISKQGYQRLLLDGNTVRLDDVAPSAFRVSVSALTVIQDRVKLSPANRARFIEACEQAYHFGKGKLAIRFAESADQTNDSAKQQFTGSTLLFTNHFHCAQCDIEYREPTPALFSFNHPAGACPTCRGFGRVISIDYNLVLPDRSKTLAEGVVKPWQTGHGVECQEDMIRACRRLKVPTDLPFDQLSEKWQRFVIEGDPDYGKDDEHRWPRVWYGVKGYFRWLESKSYKMHVRVLLSRYRAYTPCPDCHGARFQPDTLLYRLNASGMCPRNANDHSSVERQPRFTLADFYQLPIRDAVRLVKDLTRQTRFESSEPIRLVLDEVQARLGFLNDIGLGYLTLDRTTRSLSGGETERVNLTTCLGTRLVNTLFVLDEPSVGLHPRDTDRLVRILQQLRDTGNTVVVVEHEASVMRAADQIVDLGPGHGATGGQVVFQGTYQHVLKSKESLTGRYLSGRETIAIPQRREARKPKREIRNPKETRNSKSEPAIAASEIRDSDFEVRVSDLPLPWLSVINATRHNLKNVAVSIPLGRFVCVTGVSGSGKTTLVREVLLPGLERALKCRETPTVKASERIDDENDDQSETSDGTSIARVTGFESLDRVVLVDQSILGKTPRSNPAVYVGAFDDIREFFAQSEPARQRGLNASAFSFNSPQGQCERCRGAGFEKIEMQFLSDVFIRCPDCDGRRYREHILEVKVKRQSSATVQWSIADFLEATVDEAIEFLSEFQDSRPANRARASLKLLQEVGLGYLRLGQPINTLSGGESQRLKLVRHLAEATAAKPTFESRKLKESRTAKAETGHKQKEVGNSENQKTLFLFDEPTTGLHFDDVRILLRVFQRLVDAGHSVLVIEHNLDVIKSADWIIDLGPDAGSEGGKVVAQGTPEEVAACEPSHTGSFLRQLLGFERTMKSEIRLSKSKRNLKLET